MIKTIHHLLALFSVTLAFQGAYAQQTDLESLLTLDFAALVQVDVISVIGSRNNRARNVADLPVPVDIFSAETFNRLGNNADITDNLRLVMPSYTATPATGDGSAFVRPTSLRGMAPDQTLVLVNGKRRHRSALVHFFAPAAGNGAHGPDIGMIPSIALQSVEILRDGAAAQYGSDAIAGVINFVVKDDDDGGEVLLEYGEYYEGEQSTKLSANVGLKPTGNSFLNLSLEHVNNQALSRGLQRPDAQALIDSGVEGVGADSPFSDAPLVQSWGRPETSGTRAFLNAGVELNASNKLYLQSNYANIKGRYRFFYRNPDHSSLAPLRASGYSGLVAGYTPFLDGAQQDRSLTGGIKGVLNHKTHYDFSIGYGQNKLAYQLQNSINPSLGLVSGEPAQRNFSVGGYEQEEIGINLDISTHLKSNLNLAYGAEWREEVYTINPGQVSSYLGAGVSGLAGFKPQDSGEFKRNNYSLYVDLEQDLSEAALLQYALRYENFSDFGSTLNGKLAGRYRFSEKFMLRGAVSTGFHAPTPGQANLRTTITTFDGSTGLQVEEGLVPATSPQAMAVGGTTLKEEQSVNLSLGFTSNLNPSSYLAVDFYKITVDDRIYRTGDITVPETGSTISFYTNALDIETHGVDIVLNTGYSWSSSIHSNFSFAYNYVATDVIGQSPIGNINPVSESIIEDIENNYPNSRWVITTDTAFSEHWNLMLRANYYGEHYDERSTINDPISPSANIGSSLFVDMELRYQHNEKLAISIGAVNLFDHYVDKISSPDANRLSVGLPYPRRSVANYEGGSWYLKMHYSF